MLPYGVTIPATAAEVGNPGGTYELPCIIRPSNIINLILTLLKIILLETRVSRAEAQTATFTYNLQK